jgi:hypothetical protein
VTSRDSTQRCDTFAYVCIVKRKYLREVVYHVEIECEKDGFAPAARVEVGSQHFRTGGSLRRATNSASGGLS